MRYKLRRPNRGMPGRKTWKRTDWSIEPCPKCGYKEEMKDE